MWFSSFSFSMMFVFLIVFVPGVGGHDSSRSFSYVYGVHALGLYVT